MRSTHTYAVLGVSPAAYDEIARLLRDAGYEHAFDTNASGEVVIDMHGIALGREEAASIPALVGGPIRGAPDGSSGFEYKLLHGDGAIPRSVVAVRPPGQVQLPLGEASVRLLRGAYEEPADDAAGSPR